ncbi:glutaredoxin family protein [Thalassotalea ganghwensis]
MKVNAEKSSYYLFSSEGCHLCEQALELIRQVIDDNKLTIIDIVSDDKLVDLYGVHIPVLERQDTKEKLFWPFELSEIEKLIS